MAVDKNKSLDKIAVDELMTRRVTCLTGDDTIHRALEIMSEEGLAALPVVNHSDKCMGILSRSDLADLFVGLDDCVEQMSELRFAIDFPDGFGTTVGELMNIEVISIGPEESIVAAAKLMSKHRIHHLPVVDGNEKLIGIISTLDIAGAVAKYHLAIVANG